MPVREELSAEWRALAATVDAAGPADETTARRLAESFAAYLKACKDDQRALSTLPPGRFLMPGDLEGSPALTFAPLPKSGEGRGRSGSLQAMMERRYEAYKTHVIKPFFREHIARLDRQIVLIDAMQAMNAGPDAMADLERALTEILGCFRPGRGSFLTDLFSHRIDRILIAATKADQLHHESHDRLQAIVRRLADRAVARANFSGADVDVLAMAAVRATREGTVKQGRETLPVIIGTPLAGETIGKEKFDGKTETAIFPGDLPERAEVGFRATRAVARQAKERPADPLRALPAAEDRAHGRRRIAVAAAHPARPRAAVPDRRQAGMSEPRRPAAFRVEPEPERRSIASRSDSEAPRASRAPCRNRSGCCRSGRDRRLRRRPISRRASRRRRLRRAAARGSARSS